MKYRTFTSEDQIAFAELSGDYNPLHIDAIAARRLLFGSSVVHGIHALLWVLDCCLENRTGYAQLRSVKAFFPRPLKVGEKVGLSFKYKNDETLSISLLNRESIVIRAEVELHKSVKRTFDYIKPCFPKKLQPLVLSYDEIESDSGALDLYLNVEAATKMFPDLIRCLSPLQIAVILGTTRLVGVICPGLHSLYSEIDLSTAMLNQNTTMKYEVAKLDRRFGMVLINIIAPEMTGIIKAFRRPEPQEQSNYLTVRQQVNSNEFAGQRALIIGGSRGLGEVAAKLLSGGGADVKLTYHRGKQDARRITDEIVSNGGAAASFRFDVLVPKIEPHDISLNNWVPTHLYYFATPFIFSGVKGIFSPELFAKFCDYYVVGFINTVNLLSEFGIRRIFYPSTVAINELPTNMGEYAAAKIASEMLCTFMEKTNREMTICKPRFPRLSTDQTVSIMPVTNQDPVTIMIKELRSFRDSSFRNNTLER